MKRYTYLKADLDALLVERADEDGETFGEWIKRAIILRLGTTDPPEDKRVPQKDEEDYGELEQKSIRMSKTEWHRLGVHVEEEGFKSYSAVFRAWTREKLNIPVPPKVKRAPRDKDLSAAVIHEAQVDSFNDMRNLRIEQEGQEKVKTLEVWDRIRADPTGIFLVNLCRVNLCRNSDLGLHKHAGNQLRDYADAIEDGGRT